MIIKLPMILKPLGPSFWLLQFFCQTTTESYGSYGLSLIFQLLNRASFIKKKKYIKDYKDHFCMEITPPPPRKKRNRVVWTCDCFCLFSKSYNIIYHILCIECKNRFRKDILTNVNNFIIDLLKQF